MKSAVETLSPTRAKLTVEVPFEELKPSLDKAYKTIAQQINVPGFRRGKVPPMVIDRQVGRGAVLERGDQRGRCPQKYVEALQAHDLQPLAQPEIEVTRIEDNEALEFTAEVDVRPEITVPDYARPRAPRSTDIEVTDDDVEEQVEALRERFGTLDDVERAGRRRRLRRASTSSPPRTASRSRAPRSAACPTRSAAAACSTGLDEALAGMSAGDEKTFTSQLVGGDLVGEDVEVQVKVAQVQEQELPELDDEFAQLASEFDTADELTADVRDRLGSGKRLEQAAAARDAVLEKLLDQVEVPLPESDGHRRAQRSAARTSSSSSPTPASRWRSTSRTRARPRRSSRPTSSAGSATPWPRSSSSTRSPRSRGARRRPERALPAPGAARPAVRPGPAGVRQPHVRAQPHPRAGRGDPCAARRWPRSWRARPSPTRSGNVVDLKNLRPDGTIGDPAEATDRRRRRGRAPTRPSRPPTDDAAATARPDRAVAHRSLDLRRRSSLGGMVAMIALTAPGPRLLDAAALLAEVADELVVRTVARHPPAPGPTGSTARCDRPTGGASRCPRRSTAASPPAVYGGLGAGPAGRRRAGLGALADARRRARAWRTRAAGRFLTLGRQRADRRPAGARAAAARDPAGRAPRRPRRPAAHRRAWRRRSRRRPAGWWSSCTGCRENESAFDRHRDRVGTTYAETLAEQGWTPVLLRANTGLGCARTAWRSPPCCSDLVEAWPVEVDRIALVGHSMGGLSCGPPARWPRDAEPPVDARWSPTSSPSGTPHLGAPLAGGVGPRGAGAGPAARDRGVRPDPRPALGRACSTSSTGWPRTCRRCRTRATTWSRRP